MADQRNRPLRVLGLLTSRRDDAERGPAIFMNPDDARIRLLEDGELVWVHGTRRHELAVLHVSPDQARGDVTLRDVIGASPSEIIRVVKPDMDTRDWMRDRLKPKV